MAISEWCNITSDTEILSTVRGASIEFDSPPRVVFKTHTSFSPNETDIIDGEILKLLGKGIIELTTPNKDIILSNIFTRPKKDGNHRLILNLRDVNQFVTYRHFKMDSLQSILKLVHKNCFMASLDLKDAYYSVSISPSYRKYLCFRWRDNLYRFTCLPNGLSSCPRVFTKLLKPVLATLHKAGHIVASYIDDLFIQGKTYEGCVYNVIDTFILFDKLGFIIHPTKSVFNPSQQLVLLGFVINSTDMTIRLTGEKVTALKAECDNLLKSANPRSENSHVL